ncbi:hypothetical protein GAY33_08825 [Azospirillum brasilense]|uniref:hypothetical protein n=1 Tax=Azospirillum argentinense TaxID=2970906 RepID=UPI00190AFB16|nr:hypothetical protein [Azospirillum argentinense]
MLAAIKPCGGAAGDVTDVSETVGADGEQRQEHGVEDGERRAAVRGIAVRVDLERGFDRSAVGPVVEGRRHSARCRGERRLVRGEGGSEAGRRARVAEHVGLVDPGLAPDRQLTVMGDRNLVVVPKPAVGGTVLVGLLPGGSNDGGVVRHAVLLVEPHGAGLDAQVRDVDKREVAAALLEEGEARVQVKVFAVRVPEPQRLPVGLDDVRPGGAEGDEGPGHRSEREGAFGELVRRVLGGDVPDPCAPPEPVESFPEFIEEAQHMLVKVEVQLDAGEFQLLRCGFDFEPSGLDLLYQACDAAAGEEADDEGLRERQAPFSNVDGEPAAGDRALEALPPIRRCVDQRLQPDEVGAGQAPDRRAADFARQGLRP